MEQLRLMAAFFRRDATMTLSYPLAFWLRLFGTVGSVLMLWLPAQLLGNSQLFAVHGGFLAYAIIGTALMEFFLASYGGFASAIRNEQLMGTLEAILLSPARMGTLIVGSNLWTMSTALLDTVVILTVGTLIFRVPLQGHPLTALLFLVLTNLTFTSVGIFSATFVLVFKRGDPLRTLLSASSFLLGGVIYPLDVFPRWVQYVAQLLPVTHGARAVRAVLIEGRPLASLVPELCILIAFCLVAVPSSLLSFHWALRRSLREGTLLLS